MYNRYQNSKQFVPPCKLAERINQSKLKNAFSMQISPYKPWKEVTLHAFHPLASKWSEPPRSSAPCLDGYYSLYNHMTLGPSFDNFNMYPTRRNCLSITFALQKACLYSQPADKKTLALLPRLSPPLIPHPWILYHAEFYDYFYLIRQLIHVRYPNKITSQQSERNPKFWPSTTPTNLESTILSHGETGSSIISFLYNYIVGSGAKDIN